MIIECPECGARNSTDKPLESGGRYRCGKCGTLLVFTQTGTFTKVPLDKTHLKANVKSKGKSRRLGCFGLIAVSIIIIVAINLFSSDDNAQQTSPTPTSNETQTINENPRHIYEDGAELVGGDGKPIELINNPKSINPTYAELIDFIKEDGSDRTIYEEGIEFAGRIAAGYVCADYAEDVHNNAEVEGIKAAWVSIDLYGEEIGHACNAFQTIDRGLVYIDCTGGTLSERLRFPLGNYSGNTQTSTSWDSIAYAEIGKEYGRIDIDKAESPLYSFYEEYKRKLYECQNLLSDYNEQVMQYNQEIEGKIYYIGTPEYAEIEAWEARIDNLRQLIDELQEEIGESWFESTGIVEDIHIHWGNN